jgi:hypothetical protein
MDEIYQSVLGFKGNDADAIEAMIQQWITDQNADDLFKIIQISHQMAYDSVRREMYYSVFILYEWRGI